MGTDDMLRRWLIAERGVAEVDAPEGAQTDAEQALRELLLVLPEARPRVGFAERVMAASGRAGDLAAASGRALGGWLRALAAACLLTTGTALAVVPTLAALLGAELSLADAVSGTAVALTLGVDYLVTLIAVGEVFASLHSAMLAVVTTPAVTLAWLGSLVLAALTPRWLAQLLSPKNLPHLSPPGGQGSPGGQRSSGYVPAV